MKLSKNATRRATGITELAMGIALVLLVLFIGSFLRLRQDLTTEKRYTLTEATKDLVDSLKDVVYVKVYLHGDLPADMQRLSTSVRDLLDEMRVRNPEELQYTFIDPSAGTDEETRNKVYAQLQEAGLQYSSIRTQDKGAQKEVITWPGALLTYKGKTLPVQLLKAQFRNNDADMVNRSINNLEYEITSAIRQVTQTYRPRVAFLHGHGELGQLPTQDLANALAEQYDVTDVRLDGRIDALSIKTDAGPYRANQFEAAIVAKPDSAFSEKDQFILDQFIMNGGKVLWAVDAMDPHLDSLRKNQFSMATPLDLGLDRLLFAYGIRINNDVLVDRQCAPIQLYTRPYGNQPKLETLPFPFEPIVVPERNHPIVANLDPVHLKFASTIDTIATDSAASTILLTSSAYSRALRNPVRVSLAIVDMDLGLDKNNTPHRSVSVLTQGRFRSAFADRLVMPDSAKRAIGYREWSRPTAMLTVSDGDALANPTDPAKGTWFPLGYERMARAKVYGNREFFVNAMNYLLNDQSLISIRSRAITLRQLDPVRTAKQRTAIQVANIALPVLAGLLMGLGFHLMRRRRHAHTP